MKLLLDTCCIIWAVSDPSSLSGKATDVLEREDSAIFVSPISCAEIACLSERGRIELDQHWKLWFNYYLELNGWQIKDIDLTIIQEAYSLPDSFHSDPVDRIITATARIHDLVLLTADGKILSLHASDTDTLNRFALFVVNFNHFVYRSFGIIQQRTWNILSRNQSFSHHPIPSQHHLCSHHHIMPVVNKFSELYSLQ